MIAVACGHHGYTILQITLAIIATIGVAALVCAGVSIVHAIRHRHDPPRSGQGPTLT